MIVLGVNKVLKWCQVFANGRRYTCPIKEVDGKLFFFFKKAWHCVKEFAPEGTRELVEECGKIIERPLGK